MGVTIDGTSLTDPARRWWLDDGSNLRQPPAVTINNVKIHGSHGVIPALSSTFNAGGCQLVMGLKAATYSTLMANVATLTRLMVGSRRTLRTLVDTDTDCRARVEYVSASDLEMTGRAAGRLSFTYSIPRGFWEDVDATTVDLGAADGTKEPGQLKGGSAPIVDPLFVAGSNGAGTDVTVTDDDTGTWFRFDGNVPEGQAVRIRPDTATAHLVDADSPWSGGSDVSGLLDIGPGQFQLTETIAFTVAAAGAAGLQVRARKAYL